MDIGEEKREIIVVPIETPVEVPDHDPVPVPDIVPVPAPAPAEPAKEPVGV